MKSPLKVSVTVDDREAGCGVVEALRSLEAVEVSIRRLELGDYQIGDELVVERKALADLAQSIKDGRLFRQIRRLATSSNRGVLLLEGTSRDLAGSGMRREAIQGALITVSLIFGVPILRSMGPEESARLMIYAGRQVREIARGALQRKGVRPKGKRRTQLDILQGLPGIGPGRAERLLDAFGSVEAVLTAAAQDLKMVPGVGAGTAERIRWAVSDVEAEYLAGGGGPIL